MADNFAYTPGSGETGAADDIGGVKFPRVKLIYGVDGTNSGDVAAANPLPTTDAAVAALLGATNTQLPDSPRAYTSRITVTRPANTTAYTAGDVVGGAITFAAIGATAGRVILTTALLRYDVAAVPSGMTTFRLYLYDVTPPSALADNAVFDIPSGDRTAYLGYIDLGAPVDIGSTLITAPVSPNLQAKLAAASTSLFGYLVTAGAYTPAANSETLEIGLHSAGL